MAKARATADATLPVPALRCRVMDGTRQHTGRILAARRLIDPVFLGTPLFRCEALEPRLGCTVSIKLEPANPVCSFSGCSSSTPAW
jgi:threonine dehydratase